MIKKQIKNILTFLANKLRIHNMYIIEKKKIKKKKDLINSVNLTKEQIKEINNIWIENYGKKIPKDWHKLYTSYTGIFNEKYFPEIFFTTNLLDKLNPYFRKKYIDDKALLTYYFAQCGITNKECQVVKNIIYNCSNYFYDNNRNIKL